jgi:hypothetical protein
MRSSVSAKRLRGSSPKRSQAAAHQLDDDCPVPQPPTHAAGRIRPPARWAATTPLASTKDDRAARSTGIAFPLSPVSEVENCCRVRRARLVTLAFMELNEPLPRLLRLRGMVARSVPPDGNAVGSSDAPGLTDAYNRLRDAACETAAQLGLDPDEFDRELPALPSAADPRTAGMATQRAMLASARSAATSLRALAGYVEGLIEAVVLEQKITMEQVQAAREAARQPPGFR